MDYEALLKEDATRDPQDRDYGTFNRHYMEYSMFALRDLTKALSPDVDYDHYSMELPTLEDYTLAMPVPVYFDYSSAVTKHHILSNPHLVQAILCTPGCFKLVEDWENHYRASLGDLRGYVTNEIFMRMAETAIRLADDEKKLEYAVRMATTEEAKSKL